MPFIPRAAQSGEVQLEEHDDSVGMQELGFGCHWLWDAGFGFLFLFPSTLLVF